MTYEERYRIVKIKRLFDEYINSIINCDDDKVRNGLLTFAEEVTKVIYSDSVRQREK